VCSFLVTGRIRWCAPDLENATAPSPPRAPHLAVRPSPSPPSSTRSPSTPSSLVSFPSSPLSLETDPVDNGARDRRGAKLRRRAAASRRAPGLAGEREEGDDSRPSDPIPTAKIRTSVPLRSFEIQPSDLDPVVQINPAGNLHKESLSFSVINPHSTPVQKYLHPRPFSYTENPELPPNITRSPAFVFLHIKPYVFIFNYINAPGFLQNSPWTL
jgi:hypothetical protein